MFLGQTYMNPAPVRINQHQPIMARPPEPSELNIYNLFVFI